MSAVRRTLAITTALVTVGIATVWTSAQQSDTTPAQVLAVTPADGSALADPPEAVTLRLSASADAVLSHITVRDSTGAMINEGRVKADGETGLRQPVNLDQPGDYSIAYHITFKNGQDKIGVARFSVGTGLAPRDTGAIPDATVGTIDHVHGVDPVGATLVVIDGLVLLVVVVLLLRTRGRRASDPSSREPVDGPAQTAAAPTAPGRDRTPADSLGD